MHLFLGFNVVLIGGWASMFASITFRWTFSQWRFFSIISTAAVFLSLVTLVLGIWCRKNFGSDLHKYLHAQSRISEDEEFVSAYPEDSNEKRFSTNSRDFEEKISFPSPNGSIPTFGSTFGSNPPSRNASNNTTSTFMHANTPMQVASPPATYQSEWNGRRVSVGSAHSVSTIDQDMRTQLPTQVRRNNSGGSGRSGARLQKKWVIE